MTLHRPSSEYRMKKNIELHEKAPGKQRIEYWRAKDFLVKYNQQQDSSFKIKELSDSPDVVCEDENGDRLNLEITLIEDRCDDIKSLLGRSDHKNSKLGTKLRLATDPIQPVKRIYKAIRNKINNHYGSNVALVICYTTLLKSEAHESDWKDLKDHRFVLDDIDDIPFDKGIWVISLRGSVVFRIL